MYICAGKICIKPKQNQSKTKAIITAETIAVPTFA